MSILVVPEANGARKEKAADVAAPALLPGVALHLVLDHRVLPEGVVLQDVLLAFRRNASRAVDIHSVVGRRQHHAGIRVEVGETESGGCQWRNRDGRKSGIRRVVHLERDVVEQRARRVLEGAHRGQERLLRDGFRAGARAAHRG